MKRLSGFSLMEMMVVLLIVSIVAAATAPMVSKKMTAQVGKKCNWETYNKGLYYGTGMNKTVSIGANNGDGARLFINSKSWDPQIVLRDNDEEDQINLTFAEQTIAMTSNDLSKKPTGSVVIGYNAKLNNNNNIGDKAVSIGYKSIASGEKGIAVGYEVEATKNSIAIGNNVDSTNPTKSYAENSIAIGNGARAGGKQNSSSNHTDTIAIGHKPLALGDNAISIGSGVEAGQDAIAIGSNVPTVQQGNTTYNGQNTHASTDSIAIGKGAYTKYEKSIAIGYMPENLASETIAIGTDTYHSVYSTRSIAIGTPGSRSTDDYLSTMTRGSNSIAIGQGAQVRGSESIAMGYFSEVRAWDDYNNFGFYNIAIGANAQVINDDDQIDNSTAIGADTIVESSKATAIGSNARAEKDYGTAIGYSAKAKGSYSTAIGYGAEATKSNQIVLGTEDSTVYIPGKLIVNGSSMLGLNGDSKVYVNLSDDSGIGMARLKSDSGVWGDPLMVGDKAMTTGTTIKYEDAAKALSDRRLKNVGEVFKGGLEEIKKLEVYNYTFKKDKDKTPRVGVIAQDLQKIFPNAVFKGDDGFLRIRMEDMFFALVNAVKELDMKINLLAQKQKKIDELESKVNKLEKENNEYKNSLEALEKRISNIEKLNK